MILSWLCVRAHSRLNDIPRTTHTTYNTEILQEVSRGVGRLVLIGSQRAGMSGGLLGEVGVSSRNKERPNWPSDVITESETPACLAALGIVVVFRANARNSRTLKTTGSLGAVYLSASACSRPRSMSSRVATWLLPITKVCSTPGAKAAMDIPLLVGVP
jgi:hypothetical protein